METERIIIRKAVPEDAPFIAKCVTEAMGIPCFGVSPVEKDTAALLAVMEELCGMEESLYSWKHADMAIDSLTGKTAGCLVSYDGSLYESLRAKTFSYAQKKLGKEIPATGMETGPGEYYLDSLAVLPEMRGFKTGRRLMLNAVKKAREAGAGRISLIVDKDAPGLQAYYASAGFSCDGEIIFFGHPYIRMITE